MLLARSHPLANAYPLAHHDVCHVFMLQLLRTSILFLILRDYKEIKAKTGIDSVLKSIMNLLRPRDSTLAQNNISTFESSITTGIQYETSILVCFVIRGHVQLSCDSD